MKRYGNDTLDLIYSELEIKCLRMGEKEREEERSMLLQTARQILLFLLQQFFANTSCGNNVRCLSSKKKEKS